MRIISVGILGLFVALMLYAATALPARGDLNAPMHHDVSAVGTPVASTYYIRNAYRDAQTANMVTAVLGDYRSFDTLGEVIVVLTAGLCCMLILRKQKP